MKGGWGGVSNIQNIGMKGGWSGSSSVATI
jgi:hypothetical protein